MTGENCNVKIFDLPVPFRADAPLWPFPVPRQNLILHCPGLGPETPDWLVEKCGEAEDGEMVRLVGIVDARSNP